MPVVLPIIVCTKKGLAQLIPPINNGMGGEGIIGITVLSFTLVHGVSAVLDVSSTVGLGKEQQVIMDFVALDKHIIADNGTRLP